MWRISATFAPRVEFANTIQPTAMIILVLNCGSSSIKYQVLAMGDVPQLLCKGLVERVGASSSPLEHRVMATGLREKRDIHASNHSEGIACVLEMITDPRVGVVESVDRIEAVGHRVVHGGERFAASALITPEVEAEIEGCFELAPLHNPANLMGIRAMRGLLPQVPQVAVFDTAFHQTLPPEAYRYALPSEYYERLRVRKYGFHGTSHMYVAQRAGQILGKAWDALRIITCHLGNGASVSAVDHGRSVDTSMGFTPVDGLMMGTRCGEVDPSALIYIAEKEGLSYEALKELINGRSGILGVSGVSNDMRNVDKAVQEGNHEAALARNMFVYRIRKCIGAYVAAMEGMDAIVFTGGIGENDAAVRGAVGAHLGYLGAELDAAKNETIRGAEATISTPASRVALLVIPTDEEGMIARDTWRIATEHRGNNR